MAYEGTYRVSRMMQGKGPKRYDKDGPRTCLYGDCISKPNSYNKSPYCHVHKPFKRPRLRGATDLDIVEEERAAALQRESQV